MRRRTLLITAGTVSVSPVLEACTSPSRKDPAPTPPPGPDAIPYKFTERPSWPGTNISVSIKAARDRYLCSDVAVDELRDVFASGHCPVIVDVAGPTTRAVTLDETGAWTTKEVALTGRYDKGKDNIKAPTKLWVGPALLDETHAYLVLGVLAQQGDDTSTTSADDTTTCPVIMLKIRLSDGSVAASATVSDRFFAKEVSGMHLSFSTDRTALLLAGDNGGRQSSATQKSNPDYVALRLNAEDLSIQFDAHSILNSKRTTSITSYGQAIGSKYATSPSEMIIFLADGRYEFVKKNDHPIMVRDGWYYYGYGDLGPDKRTRARNLASNETVELQGTWEKEVGNGVSWPSITSDGQAIISGTEHAERDRTNQLIIRLPGAASPTLSWKAGDQKIPEGASVLGDVLYTCYDPDDSESTSNHHIDLTSLATGEKITETEGPGSALLSGVRDVVTPWGIANYFGFYAATAWIDHTPSAGSPSPSTPQPTSPKS